MTKQARFLAEQAVAFGSGENCRNHLSAALVRERHYREKLARAAYIAENLLGMIDRETWRAQGGEAQGHYEGDYFAEQVYAEIVELKALGGDK